MTLETHIFSPPVEQSFAEITTEEFRSLGRDHPTLSTAGHARVMVMEDILRELRRHGWALRVVVLHGDRTHPHHTGFVSDFAISNQLRHGSSEIVYRHDGFDKVVKSRQSAAGCLRPIRRDRTRVFDLPFVQQLHGVPQPVAVPLPAPPPRRKLGRMLEL